MAQKITDYIHLSIATAARGIRQQVVDVPLLFGYHTKWADYTRTYTSLSGLTSDGFATTDPIYLMAKALLSQDRKVSSFKVGRKATPTQHAVVLTVTADTGSITATISKGGTTRTYTRTGAGGGIPAEATALALLMNNDTDGWGSGGSAELTIVASTNDVEIDAASADGQIWYYSGLSNITFDDATPDTSPTLATDLAALQAEDDDWYAVTMDTCGGTLGAALAAALSSQEKLVVQACQDSDCASGGGMVGTYNTQAYTRAAAIYKQGPMSEYVAAACLGYSLPWAPGALDWMFKTYTGVTADDLSASNISGLKAVYGNMYVQVVRDAGIFQIGTVGSGQYIDIVHLKDYLTFRIREAIWNLLRTNPKLPYTNKGARAVGQEIKAVLKSAATNALNQGGDALTLTDDEGRSTFNFDFTPAESQLAADKASRIFRGFTWQCTLSSSMREVYITGELV